MYVMDVILVYFIIYYHKINSRLLATQFWGIVICRFSTLWVFGTPKLPTLLKGHL